MDLIDKDLLIQDLQDLYCKADRIMKLFNVFDNHNELERMGIDLAIHVYQTAGCLLDELKGVRDGFDRKRADDSSPKEKTNRNCY